MRELEPHPHFVNELKKYGACFEWRKHLLAGRTEVELDKDKDGFLYHNLEVIGTFKREYQHRLRIEEPYSDDFDRLAQLKEGIRGADWVFLCLRNWDHADAAKEFRVWLAETVTDMSITVSFIEDRYPERKTEFDADRQAFTDVYLAEAERIEAAH